MGNTESGDAPHGPTQGRVIAYAKGAVPHAQKAAAAGAAQPKDGIVTVQGQQRTAEELEGDQELVQLVSMLPLMQEIPQAPVGRTPMGCISAPHQIDLRWIVVLYRDYQHHLCASVDKAEQAQGALSAKIAASESTMRDVQTAFTAHALAMKRLAEITPVVPAMREQLRETNKRVQAALDAAAALTRALAFTEMALQDAQATKK